MPGYARGIDVSLYNGRLSPALLAGLDFVIVRASIGAARDRRYPDHAARTLGAGKVLGAYHFMRYGPGPTRQAETFLSVARDAHILALDVEGPALAYPATARAIIINIRQRDPFDRPIGMYGSDGTWPGDLGQDFDWVARWGGRPRRPWRFWQWQGAPLDRNIYRGTAAGLRAWAGVD